MKTYKYRSRQFGFQLLIPDSWGRARLADLLARMSNARESFQNPSGKASDSRILLGPDGKYLHILVTPLSESESESTIDETEEYFDALSYRQSLHVIATGAIRVANKDHFWAKYYRMSRSQIQFIKKYCLYLNRAEYLLTAGLYFASSGQKLPTDQMIRDSEKVYDEIVRSFESVKRSI